MPATVVSPTLLHCVIPTVTQATIFTVRVSVPCHLVSQNSSQLVLYGTYGHSSKGQEGTGEQSKAWDVRQARLPTVCVCV